jgi:hypothetical protein
LQARLTSALLLPLSPVLKWHGQYQGLGTIPAVAGCPSPLGYDPQVPPYASKTLPSSSGITSMSHHARLNPRSSVLLVETMTATPRRPGLKTRF